MKSNKFRRSAAVILSALMISSCTAALPAAEANAVSKDTVTTISLPSGDQPLSLEINNTYKIGDILSRIIPNFYMDITSDNSSVVKVKGNTITARKEGKANIIIKTPFGSISKAVIVQPREMTLEFDISSITLGSGENAVINAITTGISRQKIKWTSTNSKVVTVDESGKLVGKKTGKATVTAVLPNGKTASCSVSVKKAPTNISLSSTGMTLGLGEKKELDFTLPGNAASYNVKYTSDNPKVLTVDPTSGKLTTNRTGKATVTVTTYNGKTAKCTIDVMNAPKTIKLNRNSITLEKNGSSKIRTTLPGGAYSELTYTSSNSRVATVTPEGVVIGRNPGTAYIAVRTFNGKTATCKVTVR